MRSLSLALASLTFALAAGCGSAKPDPILKSAGPVPTPAPPADNGPPRVQTTLESVGLDGSALDRSVDACTDFYQYACGGWIKKTEIPGDEVLWDRSFSEIQKRNEAALRSIVEDAASAKSPDANTKKLGDYYASCMDTQTIDAEGIKPIKPLLDRMKKVASSKDVVAAVKELHQRASFVVFSIEAQQDPGDATRIITKLDQSGLGLPDRDYYTKDDEDTKKLRAEYVAHVERMMKLAGYSEKDAKAAAADVMSVETDLAKIAQTVVERRDPKKLYNKIKVAELGKKSPAVAWESYFKALGMSVPQEVNLASVSYFEGISKLIESIKPKVWSSYLAWHAVRGSAHFLAKAFTDEQFVFVSKITGQKEDRPRWRRCLNETDQALGEVLAQPFVARHFGADSKQAAEQMVHEISKAFAVEVKSLDWMDEKTKQRAIEKLNKMAYLIGYPSKWRTYDFAIDRKRFADNALAATAFELKRKLAKIGKPVDREEWQMNPPDVNAYYDPQMNHMVFPAGILQAPFYDIKAAVQVNLGAIGMVVGHELTHGFDDEGSQYAGNGNLEDWWEPAVGEKFRAKTTCVAEQYDKYEVLPGVKLSGKLTLGENIADLGGIKLAFAAYRQMRKGAANTVVADGFSEDQQFFLAAAQGWCAKRREEIERLLANVDPHSAPRFRINGPLSNLPEFAQAFSCKEGTAMHPKNTCSVW